MRNPSCFILISLHALYFSLLLKFSTLDDSVELDLRRADKNKCEKVFKIIIFLFTSTPPQQSKIVFQFMFMTKFVLTCHLGWGGETWKNFLTSGGVGKKATQGFMIWPLATPPMGFTTRYVITLAIASKHGKKFTLLSETNPWHFSMLMYRPTTKLWSNKSWLFSTQYFGYACMIPYSVKFYFSTPD